MGLLVRSVIAYENKKVFLFAEGGALCVCAAVYTEFLFLLDLSPLQYDNNELSGYSSYGNRMDRPEKL